jgi:hypothetical protein
MTNSRTNIDDPVRPRPYAVSRIERTDGPQGSEGNDWYRYVLDNGRSTVVGQRQGTRKDVESYAIHCAEQLNARGLHGKSSWAPRGRKPAAATSSS